MLRLFLTFLWARELWNFLFRWFSKAAAKDPLWLNVAKFFLYGFLAGNQFFLSLPVAIVSSWWGQWMMNAGISGVTYYIYVKDGIRPRFRLLIDTIWLSVVGIATLIALGATATCKCSSFRFISWGLGLPIFETAGSLRPKLERKSFADVCVVGCRLYLLHWSLA